MKLTVTLHYNTVWGEDIHIAFSTVKDVHSAYTLPMQTDGKGHWFVTLEGDFSYVYATDSDSAEKEGVTEQKVEYVTVGSGSSEPTVLLTRTLPAIKGIGVVCRGGGDANVRRELITLLSTTFGIGSNKIYVAEAIS